jgi:hypothetical protein
VQLTFAAHAVQAPFAQTRPSPHEVPLSATTPRSMHVGVSPAQLCTTPLWHGSAGVQAPPGWQGTHAPAPQTMFGPQPVPSGALPAAVHTGAPDVHEIAPILHGTPSAQVAPALHATHAPAPLQILSP